MSGEYIAMVTLPKKKHVTDVIRRIDIYSHC
jgi:hypothetical protein